MSAGPGDGIGLETEESLETGSEDAASLPRHPGDPSGCGGKAARMAQEPRENRPGGDGGRPSAGELMRPLAR